MLNKIDYRISLSIFGIFVALYWATFGGHTYSPDEEMLYYVTEGIVERGSFEIPPRTETSSVSTGARGADGRNYAITGILQSLLAIPFYLIGRVVATVFAPAFQTYWTRFFVCLLNGVVGGATVSIMYLTGRKFRYQPLTAMFLSFSFGLATFFNVYSRTFFSEPLVTFWLLLAIYASLSYRFSSTMRWGVLLGLALGLSIATKPQSIIAWPAFVIYLLAVSFKDHIKKARLIWLGKTVLFGITGAFAPIMLVLIYNYIRFRNPLETGYTAILPPSYFQGAGLEAVYGFLFSPGKSFFLYAPPTILGLMGTKILFKRYPLETLLLWILNIIHLIFYSFFFVVWFGGGCWGPRYLTYIVPSMLLPAGAYLESEEKTRNFRKLVFILLFIIGFLVQFGAILTNFNTYYNLDFGPHHSLHAVGWDSILFNPKYSPVVGHWHFWKARYQQWKQYYQNLIRLGPNRYTFKGGFYGTEVPDLAPYGGWTSGPVAIITYAIPKKSMLVSVVYSRPLKDGIPQDEPIFSIDDQQIESTTVNLDSKTGRYKSTISINSTKIAKFPVIIKFTTALWSPADVGISGDARKLGIFIEHISVNVDGIELQFEKDLPVFEPIPVNTSRPWDGYASWWFWRADLPHLVDTWWWYVSVVGLLPYQIPWIWIVGGIIISFIGGFSLCKLIKLLPEISFDGG